MFTTALLLTLAWGALSFGAVYPWAYQPLLAALGVLGLWGLFGPTESGRHANRVLAIGLALLIAAVVLQLVPLSHQTLLAVSPAADTLLQRYDIAYVALLTRGQTAAHPLSIDPAQTRLGLMLLLGFTVFLLGLTRTLDGFKLRTLLPGLVILGVVLAMIGIVQKPLFTGKIYGFWTPLAGPTLYSPGGGPFGPFVNRNHFAGWMLMALPMAIGYFGAIVARGMHGAKPGWREGMVWFSSRDANQAVLVGFAIVVMALSLVLTLSRSGITCFMIALAISGMAVIRHQAGGSKRALIVSYLAFVAILSVSWAGIDAITARFLGVDWTLEGRLFAWQDALRIFRAFPKTGAGLNTYGVATLFYQTFQTDTFHFAEAHNDYLQFLAEGGLLLAIPTLVAIGLFAREVHRRFREGLDDSTGYWLRLGAVTSLVAISLQEIVEFSLQMPGNAALFTLLCGIAVRKASRSRPHATTAAINFQRRVSNQTDAFDLDGALTDMESGTGLPC